MINYSQNLLISVLNRANVDNNYQKALIKATNQYQIKPYNIVNLNPAKILQIYKIITQKFYFGGQTYQNENWFENQLRVFIWVVVVYSFIQRKTIEEMIEEDWRLLSIIFNHKNIISLEFQSLCLIRRKKSKKWLQQQIKLMTSIIREKSSKNHWNQIARTIFIKSGKKYFRSPKQCRQQWINHLDPTKSRSQWTTIEDYQLVKGIQKHGKKWSKVAKELGNHRTEHMVKNRYKSLLNNEMKNLLQQQSQNIIISKLKQRLQSCSCIKKLCHSISQKETLQNDDSSQNRLDSSDDAINYYKSNDKKQINKDYVQRHIVLKDKQENENVQNKNENSKILQKQQGQGKNQQKQKNQEVQFWKLLQEPQVDQLQISQFMFGMERTPLDKAQLDFFFQ